MNTTVIIIIAIVSAIEISQSNLEKETEFDPKVILDFIYFLSTIIYFWFFMDLYTL